jgi:hypothetical protein
MPSGADSHWSCFICKAETKQRNCCGLKSCESKRTRPRPSAKKIKRRSKRESKSCLGFQADKTVGILSAKSFLLIGAIVGLLDFQKDLASSHTGTRPKESVIGVLI